MSANKSKTHSLRRRAAHTQTHTQTHSSPFFFFFYLQAQRLPPSLALRLPVFLRVSVKCIHMLLRGPRLERDCFPSDKNHLAPSEEPANRRHRTVENGGERISDAGKASVYTGQREEDARVRSRIRAPLLNPLLNSFPILFQEGTR